jgi:hypothetical protein
MDTSDLTYFINLKKFPIQDQKSKKYKNIINAAREALALDGCYVLKSIINMDAIYEMQKEATSIENLAHYTSNKVNVYFSKDDPSYPKDHPRRFFMERSNGFVSGDKFPDNSKIKELYYLEIFKKFIAKCLGVTMYHYADPLASLTINVNKPGDRFSWHYDTNEFTVTMLIQDCEKGGIFQYVPNIRNKDNECYDEVLKLLKGDETRVKEIKLNEGDLQIFKGRYALHRATRAEGNKTRNLVVFTYTEKKNVIGSSHRSEELYGKTLDIHKKKRVRSDILED